MQKESQNSFALERERGKEKTKLKSCLLTLSHGLRWLFEFKGEYKTAMTQVYDAWAHFQLHFDFRVNLQQNISFYH